MSIPSLDASSTGIALFRDFDSKADEYSRARRSQVRALAAILATAAIEEFLYPKLESNLDGYPLVLAKESVNPEWLTSILLSANADNAKEQQARENVSGILESKMSDKKLDDTLREFAEILNSDFGKMKSVKQAVYYRTRSINAVLKYITSQKPSVLSRRIQELSDVQVFFEELREAFLDTAPGPKYTKNSYMAEFLAFIQEIYPELDIIQSSKYEKSLNKMIEQSMSNLSTLVANNSRIVAMQDDLTNMQQSTRIHNPNLDKEGRSENWEFGVHPTDGIIAKYTPAEITTEKLRLLEAEVILKSMDVPGLCEIEVQMLLKPVSQIVVKPVGKLDVGSFAVFKQFIDQVFRP